MTAKELKNALLQEAVQGKLVPQISSEGNARDLLEEIRKEKLSHGLDFANAKSGKRKSKKETALAGSNPCGISEEEIPFEIPENWCWCRLGEIVYNNGQKTPDKEFSYIDIGSIDNEHQKLNEKENFIQPENAPSRARKIVKKGDIIYSTVRPYLHNMCIIDKDLEKEPIASTGFAVLACYPQINNQYLFYYLLSPSFDNYANDTKNSKGVAYPAINDDRLYKGIVPLPPLAEQKRIVAAIEKFMPLIEEYGKKETELKAINEKIGTVTKKAILQEAVQGKLVPQIAAEGNARDLLEEIRKEKLSHGLDFANAKSGKKKSKKETALAGSNPCDITEDEIPFDIPESWCWCKIEDITIPIGNKNNQIQSKEVLKDGKIPVVSQGQNLIDGYSNETEKAIKDIPVIMFGDHTRNVKYIDFPFIIGADGTKFFKPILCNKYYIYYLITFISLKLRNRGYARHYSLLKEEWLPLPPLVEQKRIVDAIEKLLPLCEKLGEK